jgi:hypothetical protein
MSERTAAPAPVIDFTWLAETARPRLAADPEIRRAGRTFSGVIGLGVDARTFALVFHAGDLISVERGSLRGVAFTVRAAGPVWQAILAEPRNLFLRHFHAGEVGVEGDLIEFLRLTELVLLIVDGLRAARP